LPSSETVVTPTRRIPNSSHVPIRPITPPTTPRLANPTPANSHAGQAHPSQAIPGRGACPGRRKAMAKTEPKALQCLGWPGLAQKESPDQTEPSPAVPRFDPTISVPAGPPGHRRPRQPNLSGARPSPAFPNRSGRTSPSVCRTRPDRATGRDDTADHPKPARASPAQPGQAGAAMPTPAAA
jgi:hypothetical protein